MGPLVDFQTASLLPGRRYWSPVTAGSRFSPLVEGYGDFLPLLPGLIQSGAPVFNEPRQPDGFLDAPEVRLLQLTAGDLRLTTSDFFFQCAAALFHLPDHNGIELPAARLRLIALAVRSNLNADLRFFNRDLRSCRAESAALLLPPIVFVITR